MSTMTTKKAQTKVELLGLELKKFALKIVGETPLISHAWSQKAKLEMLNKHQKKATNGKEIRRPHVEFADSLYWLTPKPNLDGLTDEEVAELLDKIIPQSQFGFPTIGFKAAAIDAGYQQGVLDKKTTARGAFRIENEFAVIGGTPTFREDIARIGVGGTDLRFRAEFKEWSTELFITYNERSMSAEQIVNLFNIGGFANGVGDWRPAKDGTYGTFHVE